MKAYRARDRTRPGGAEDRRTRERARARTRKKKGGTMNLPKAISELAKIREAMLYGNELKKAQACQIGIEGLKEFNAIPIDQMLRRRKLPSETAM